VTYPRAWSGRLAAADVVRRLAPDTAVVLPNSVESALAAWYWGAGRRIGFAAGGRGLALTDVVPLPEPRRHQIDEYLMLAERCGGRADDTEPRLTPPPLTAPLGRGARAARRGRRARQTPHGRPYISAPPTARPRPGLRACRRALPAARHRRRSRRPARHGRRGARGGGHRGRGTGGDAGDAIVRRCCRRSSRSWTRWCRATRAWRISPPRSARPCHAVRSHRSRAVGAARPRGSADPPGAVRAVLLSRLPDRASLPARARGQTCA